LRIPSIAPDDDEGQEVYGLIPQWAKRIGNSVRYRRNGDPLGLGGAVKNKRELSTASATIQPHEEPSYNFLNDDLGSLCFPSHATADA
jgi:hypothetical protein